MNSAEMKQKIDEICKEYGITAQWIKTGRNCSNRHQKTVWIRKPVDLGDFAVALLEIGHVMCDPDEKPANARERLDTATNAWQWALERNGNDFDLEGWRRLHKSLYQYYSAVMNTNHPAHQLLVRAEQQDAGIRPRVSSYFTGVIKFGGKKNKKPEK